VRVTRSQVLAITGLDDNEESSMNKVFDIVGNSMEDLRRRLDLLRMALRAQGRSLVTIRADERGRVARVSCRTD